jgi:hypothetical protein
MREIVSVVILLVLLAVTVGAQVSAPVVPVQPDRDQYGVSDIALFNAYQSRAQYKAAFGKEAAEFDPGRRPKTWFDSTVDLSDPEADVCYKVVKVAKDGNPAVSLSCMPAFEAATVNLIPDTIIPAGRLTEEMLARTRPQREIPVRDLLPGEVLIGGFGNVPTVVRMDKKQSQEEKDGKFTAGDRALLRRIAEKLGLK